MKTRRKNHGPLTASAVRKIVAGLGGGRGLVVSGRGRNWEIECSTDAAYKRVTKAIPGLGGYTTGYGSRILSMKHRATSREGDYCTQIETPRSRAWPPEAPGRHNRRRNGPDYLRGAGFTWDRARKRLVYGDTEYTPAAAAKTFGLDGSFGLTPAVMRAAGAPESAVKAAMAAKPHNQRRPKWAGSSGARGRAYVGNPRRNHEFNIGDAVQVYVQSGFRAGKLWRTGWYAAVVTGHRANGRIDVKTRQGYVFEYCDPKAIKASRGRK